MFISKKGNIISIRKPRLNLRKHFEDDTEAVLGIAFGLCILGILVCCVIAVLGGTS